MNFINRYVIRYAVFAAIFSTTFYLSLEYFISNKNPAMIWGVAILYGLAMFLSGLLVGKRDIYEGYIGLNYHIATYVICNIVPMVLISIGWLTVMGYKMIFFIMVVWGLSLLIHIVTYIGRRKSNLKGFDKKGLFE